MYRSTAAKVKRASVWSATAALSIAGAVAAAHFASSPHPTAAPATSVTPAASVAATTPSTVSPARTVSLSATSAPSPRVVLAVSSHSISVRGTSGVVTYSLTPSTVIVSGTAHVTVSSIHAGTRVIVVASATHPSVAATIGVLAATSGEGGGEQGLDQ